MPSFCAVIGCGNRGERDNVRFFRIPAILKNRSEDFEALSRERRRCWVRSLMRGNLTETFLKHARICSNHFIKGQPADLEERSDPDWIPSQNMGYTEAQIKKLQVRKNNPDLTPTDGDTSSRINNEMTDRSSQDVHLRTSVFSAYISMVYSPPIRFNPSTPAAVEIAVETFNRIITNDRTIFMKTLLPEYLIYYTTAMVWLRILSLKKNNSQPLNQEEQTILTMIQSTKFVVPEPILLQLLAIGNITTRTNQRLVPVFPPLPMVVIEGFGGHYGIVAPPAEGVDDTIHNLYEEIPCLGTVSYAVSKAVSRDPPGSYRSLLTYKEGKPVNRNLLGFRELGYRLPGSKKLALSAGITHERFPSFPENTGFNLEFLIDISNALANTSTFKKTMVDFHKLSVTGAQSQIIIERPQPSKDTIGVLGEIRATCLVKEPEGVFGSGIFFCQQLLKESPDGDHSSWCLINDPPAEWVANRNDRRNLPVGYMQQAFAAFSICGSVYRKNIFDAMVVTPRKLSTAQHSTASPSPASTEVYFEIMQS